MYSSQPIADLHELWRRIVFSVLVSNLDDHLRNHAFLYDGEGWRLAPAYDLNPVPIEEKARELTTWISEEGPDASLDIAVRAARYFAVKDAEANGIIADVSAVVAGWRDQAQQLGMAAADVNAYASAFT
jgi:serine/threonine-protein kinase HipA